MVAANCNDQIPAKAYEYLRVSAARLLLALTDPAGDTADVIRRAGIDTIAPPNDSSVRFSPHWSISARLSVSDVSLARQQAVRMHQAGGRIGAVRACWIWPRSAEPRQRTGRDRIEICPEQTMRCWKRLVLAPAM